jgi:Helix-turn-helix domain
MIPLEQDEQICRMYHLEEKSVRQIARELGCTRQTVSRALMLDQPPTYTLSKSRQALVLGPYQARLDELLQGNICLLLEFEPGQDAQVDWVRHVGAYKIPV